jgi:hypothetical protein
MPAAAKLQFDFDTRVLKDGNGVSVTSLTGKIKTVRLYELAIMQGGQALPLPATTTITVALKKTTDPPGTLLTTATATREGWGSGSRWYYTLDLTDAALDALFSSTVQTVSTQYEIYMVLPDGQKLASITIPFTLEKNVIIPPGP